MKAKKWNSFVLGMTAALLVLVAGVNAIIDPFWHYHGPIGSLQYPEQSERYQNDGLLRNFDYDAVITGTSMCQNFKTSEFDALWGSSSVKVCYAGATFKEVDESIRKALKYQKKIRYVLRSLDGNRLNREPEDDEYEGYPYYLYDENPFNDVHYLLNKEVVPKSVAVINYTRTGGKTPTWDEYANWNQYMTFGRDAVFQTWQMYEESEEQIALAQEDYDRIRENVERNILKTARDNPETTFYMFFPPYSICYWNTLVRTKQFDAQLNAEEFVTELLLEADNIRIFSFSDRIDVTSNLDNYGDAMHYGEWINSAILQWIYSGEGELTEDNYQTYFKELHDLYVNYDYSDLEK